MSLQTGRQLKDCYIANSEHMEKEQDDEQESQLLFFRDATFKTSFKPELHDKDRDTLYEILQKVFGTRKEMHYHFYLDILVTKLFEKYIEEESRGRETHILSDTLRLTKSLLKRIKKQMTVTEVLSVGGASQINYTNLFYGCIRLLDDNFFEKFDQQRKTLSSSSI